MRSPYRSPTRSFSTLRSAHHRILLRKQLGLPSLRSRPLDAVDTRSRALLAVSSPFNNHSYSRQPLRQPLRRGTILVMFSRPSHGVLHIAQGVGRGVYPVERSYLMPSLSPTPIRKSKLPPIHANLDIRTYIPQYRRCSRRKWAIRSRSSTRSPTQSRLVPQHGRHQW
jgi:hypothetical protein